MRLRALLFAAMMAGLAALLQLAPVWLGEPAGYLLSALASLPVAVAAAAYPREAPLALPVTFLICIAIFPQEAWVFACTNGLFGLVLGRAAQAGRPWWQSALRAAFSLWVGMGLLTWVVGVAVLGPDLLKHGVPLVLLAYAGFALAWSLAYTGLFRVIFRRLAPFFVAPDKTPKRSAR